MKHVKPGRGPSAMGAFGAIIAVIFGIVLFIIIGIVQAVYNFKNATGKNRYSSFDIVDSQEEPDPWDQQFGGDADAPVFRDIPPAGAELRYCPYCGAEVGEGFAFCAKCGRKLPDIP